MKIRTIKKDLTGYLIAIQKEINVKKFKPVFTPCRFADFIGNTLTIYSGNQSVKTQHTSFKDALKFLLDS